MYQGPIKVHIVYTLSIVGGSVSIAQPNLMGLADTQVLGDALIVCWNTYYPTKDFFVPGRFANA